MEKTVRRLSPDLKKKIRAALEEIQDDPHLGKPLRDELKSLRSYKVSKYRIVYRIHNQTVEIQIIDIGWRNIIYERILRSIKTE